MPQVLMAAFHQTSICAKPAKMASLTLVLVLCAFVSLSDSYCFRTHRKLGETHCVDEIDQSDHPIGSSWTNTRCFRCTCSSAGMKCCDGMGRVIIHTEGCVEKYDYRTCKFHVFHPDDPTIVCAYGAVGK